MTAVTWNPSDKNVNITLSNGDLTATNSGPAGSYGVRSVTSRSSGKFYFEGVVSHLFSHFGVALAGSSLTATIGTGSFDYGIYVENTNGVRTLHNGLPVTIGGVLSAPRTFMVAIDTDAGNIWFGFDGTWQSSGNPATGINPAYSNLGYREWFAAWSASQTSAPSTCDIRLSPENMAYPIPAGFVAWDALPAGFANGASTAQAGGFADVVKAAASASGAGSANGVIKRLGGTKASFNSLAKGPNVTLADGGMSAQCVSGTGGVRVNLSRNTGRYYFEVTTIGGSIDLENGLSLYPTQGPQGNILNLVPEGVTAVAKFTRVALDLNRNRVWLGDFNGWSAGTPPVGAASITYTQGLGAGADVFIGFARFSGNSVGRCWIRLARNDFAFAPPSGFMPWDDTLEDAGRASASGSGVALAKSNYAVGNTTGAGATVLGASASTRYADATLSAAGSSEAIGFGSSDFAVGSASGLSTVLGVPSSAAGAAAGSSTASFGSIAGSGCVAAAAGSSTVLWESVTRDIAIGPSGTGTVANAANQPALVLNDGVGNFTPGVTSIVGQTFGYDVFDSALRYTITWTTARTIKSVDVWSSDYANDVLNPAPTGNEVFPAGSGGAQLISVLYDASGGGTYVALPGQSLLANDKIRRRINFPGWVVARGLRFEFANSEGVSDSPHIRVSEVSVYSPGILVTIELEEVAAATDALFAGHVIEFESDANATSTVIGNGYAILQDGGNATSLVEGIETEQAVGSAAGSSAARAYTTLSETLVDGGVAASLVLSSRSLTLQSYGVLSTSASGKVTHGEVSSGTASDKIEDENVTTRTEESTGEATDTVIGIRRVTVIEISGGIGNNASASFGRAKIELRSSGEAASQAVQRAVQALTLESFGFADETLPAPFQGSFPVFWTNSVSTGAATWEGLPFNSFIEADGTVYAAGPAGVFELGSGLDDVDADVPSEVEWDLVDNGSVQMKRMRSVYVNARSAAPFTVKVANEQGAFEYTTEIADTRTVTNHRTSVGRGLLSRQARVSLLNTKAYTAENAGIGMLESVRRI